MPRQKQENPAKPNATKALFQPSARQSQHGQNRYARQIIMPEIGKEGQTLLSGRKVLIVGAGGLGTPCAAYLAGAGVGHITIADNDVVSLSNLQRQILYNMDDIGKNKAVVLAKKLSSANDTIEIVGVAQTVTQANALELIKCYDTVVACVDNPDTRYVLNQACSAGKIPMVEGAISGFTGLVTTIVPGKSPCYRCAFPNKPSPLKKPIGVASPTPGVIGSIQAAETLKFFLNKGRVLTGKLLVIDLLAGSFCTVNINKDPNCPVCGKNPYT